MTRHRERAKLFHDFGFYGRCAGHARVPRVREIERHESKAITTRFVRSCRIVPIGFSTFPTIDECRFNKADL